MPSVFLLGYGVPSSSDSSRHVGLPSSSGHWPVVADCCIVCLVAIGVLSLRLSYCISSTRYSHIAIVNSVMPHTPLPRTSAVPYSPPWLELRYPRVPLPLLLYVSIPIVALPCCKHIRYHVSICNACGNDAAMVVLAMSHPPGPWPTDVPSLT